MNTNLYLENLAKQKNKQKQFSTNTGVNYQIGNNNIFFPPEGLSQSDKNKIMKSQIENYKIREILKIMK